MIKRQDQQIEEVNQFKNTVKSALSKSEGRIISFDNRLKELEDDYRHRGSDIRKLMEDVTLHGERLSKLDYCTDSLGSRIGDR